MTAKELLDSRFTCTCDEAYKDRGLTDPNCSKCDLDGDILDIMEIYANQRDQEWRDKIQKRIDSTDNKFEKLVLKSLLEDIK